jgi:hypothetical protein
MLSRPTRILVLVLAAAVLAAAFATVAAAHQHGFGHRVDRRATGHSSGLRAEIVSPSAGSAVTGTVRFSAAVSGGSARVTFAVDGSKVKTADGTAPSIALNTASLSEGRHTFSIVASGNGRTSSDKVTVSISRHGGKVSGSGTRTETTTSTPVKTETTTTTTPVKTEETKTTTPVKTEETTTTTPVTTPVETTPVKTETETKAPETPKVETPVTTPITTPEEPVAMPTTNKILWGAWIGEQFTGTQAPWDMNAVTDFEKLTEKPLSMVNFSAPFANCKSTTSPSSSCSFYNFPKNEMEAIRKHGAIPFFSWASSMLPAGTNQPEFQLADVISGKYDSYIRTWATAAKSWGHPFFLRFNWEMNGGWFQWSEGVNGNKAGEYVAAWRHVHDIFTEVGATNATWTWCPNVDPEGKLQSLASLYPGNEYVDWTCLDGYNWGTNPAKPDKWRTFSSLFGPTYKTITEKIAPTKPMVIGEVGSSEYGGSKAQWITEMLSELPTKFPKIRGFLWFDKDEDSDWPIETSSSSIKAFANGIKSPVYTENTFGSLASSAIQPVS